MSEKRTSRLRFGIRALLILVAVVAGVFFYLRNGPLLVKTRFAGWSATAISPNPPRCKNQVYVEYEWHPWTGWRRNGEATIEFLMTPCRFPKGPAASSPQQYRGVIGEALTCSEFKRRGPMIRFDGGNRSKLNWEPSWGNPEEVLDDYAADESIANWTPTTFLDWIGERQRP